MRRHHPRIPITFPTGVRLNSSHASEFALQFVPGVLLSSAKNTEYDHTIMRVMRIRYSIPGYLHLGTEVAAEGLGGYVPAMCQALFLPCTCLQRFVPTRSKACMLIIEERPDARVIAYTQAK
jgi:hypothetical protein